MANLAGRKYDKSEAGLYLISDYRVSLIAFQMSAMVWKRGKVWHKAKTAC